MSWTPFHFGYGNNHIQDKNHTNYLVNKTRQQKLDFPYSKLEVTTHTRNEKKISPTWLNISHTVVGAAVPTVLALRPALPSNCHMDKPLVPGPHKNKIVRNDVRTMSCNKLMITAIECKQKSMEPEHGTIGMLI